MVGRSWWQKGQPNTQIFLSQGESVMVYAIKPSMTLKTKMSVRW